MIYPSLNLEGAHKWITNCLCGFNLNCIWSYDKTILGL